ncbi:MAG: hypothetical protein HRT80_16215 [Henriciella sp.]|nr:hypothetical protein [Henriciella sp.]
MIEQSNEKARLSGWVRLWIVFAATSWVLGGLDVAFAIETFQWPLPLSEITPQSVRHLMWFLGPILMAIAWISIRWVWRGFQSPLDQASAPNMSTTEILGRTFSVLTRSVFFVIGLLAIGFLAYVTWVTTEAMDASDISDTWWGGVLVTFHLCFMLCVMWSIWQWITESPSD